MNKLLLFLLITLAFAKRKVTERGIDLIKRFEGLYLKAYYDAADVITIGYGTTNADYSITGTKITKGLTISKETAEKWLVESLNKKYAPLVNKYDSKYQWTQNEFDALISFCYNIGSIDQLTDNGQRSKKTIAEKMLLYKKSKGKVLKGLEKRRKAEHDLFVK